jgi:hypothetical protein
MNVSVRLGELACNILSRWPIKPLPPKAESGLNYQEALRDPQDGSCEQTIFATGIKLTGEFFRNGFL